VDNAATGGVVTFKASGQTGVSVAVGEKCTVYFNGTDYVKVASSTADGVTTIDFSSTGLTPATATSGAVTVAGTLVVGNGGTGLTSLTAGYIPFGAGTSAFGNSANLFWDNTNARLGIVTTSPQSDIHIARVGASQSATARLQGNQGSDGQVGVLNFSNRTDITGGYIIGSIAVNRSGDDNSGAMLFNTASTASTPSERMRITSAGRLGIGTSSPSTRLELQGSESVLSVKVTNTNTAAQSASQLTADTAALYSAAFGSTAGGTTWAGLTGSSQTVIEAQNSTSFVIGAFNNSAPIVFAQGRAEVARFDTVGNVLVGGTAARGTTVGTAHLDLFNGTAPAGTLTNGVSLYSASGDLKFMDAAGNAYSVGYRNIPKSGATKTTSYTLATADVGELIEVGSSGSIVVPDATFSTGDAVVIFNNTSGAITLTMSITTAYIGGTDADKATISLATRGICNILFISGTVCVVTGNVT
jgi:hypothetical protein